MVPGFPLRSAACADDLFTSIDPSYDLNPMQVAPSLEAQGADLLALMLRYEPSRRVTAKAALQHPYFAEIQQLLNQHLPLL